MRDPLQLLLILDLVPDNPIPLDEVLARLPDKRTDRKTFRLSDFGAKPAAPGASEPGSEWASAVTRMVEAARREAHPDGPPLHFYVAGRARLPVFAHLGQELSKWATITLLNQRPDDTWDVLSLQGTSSPPAAEPFFSVVRGLNPEAPFEAVVGPGSPWKKSITGPTPSRSPRSRAGRSSARARRGKSQNACARSSPSTSTRR